MNLLEQAKEVQALLLNDARQAGADLRSIENFRLKFLGKKGLIPALFARLGELSVTEKRQVGQVLNELKVSAENVVEQLTQNLSQPTSTPEFFDFTLPGIIPDVGHPHPISLTMQAIISIFREMGFGIEFGPEVETDYYNFQTLNFPDDHPARDMQDTFFISSKVLLRTHTSPIQIRTMLKQRPPIRILAPGRVFRNEAINARSFCAFHQVEGLYVDEKVTFSELKTTLELFAKRFFGSAVKIRFRPSFFPFTEPSAEVDVSCFICAGKGCRLCKNSGWLEILGCGMVDPNVFEAVGIDPQKYSGYAFGMGVDRITLLKYQINDIRLLWDGDVRLIEQF